MVLALLLIPKGRTPGGHGLLETVPRIYQVTPDIPDRRRATKQEQVRPPIWPTASKRVSSPPGRDPLQLVGRHRRPESQQQASKREPRHCVAQKPPTRYSGYQVGPVAM